MEHILVNVRDVIVLEDGVKMTVTDKEVEELIKDLKKIGINGFLVTASKLEEMSEKTKEESK